MQHAPRPMRAGASPSNSVDLLAPIRRPGKLLAVAGNFQAHIEEGGGQRVDKTVIVPKLFIKPSSAIIGPGEAVALPTVSEPARLGARARHRDRYARVATSRSSAPATTSPAIRSSTTSPPGRCNGVSRVASRAASTDFFDWLNGKWGDGFAAWGPYITTTDSVKPIPTSSR